MTLKEYKKKYRRTYTWLAALCCVSPQYISNIANGYDYPSRWVAELIELHTNKKVPVTNWYKKQP
jgi:hypothetical protein